MSRSKKLAVSGVFCALAVLALVVAGLVPTGRIALLCLASGFITVICAECGKGYAISGFVAVSVLAVILSSNKMLVLSFVAFFGYYPVLKLLIEQWRSLKKEWLSKVLLFLVLSVMAVLGMGVLLPDVVLPLSEAVLILGGVVVFVIYDVALSLFIQVYKERIAGLIKGGDRK